MTPLHLQITVVKFDNTHELLWGATESGYIHNVAAPSLELYVSWQVRHAVVLMLDTYLKAFLGVK